MSSIQVVNRIESLSKSMSRKGGISSAASTSLVNILNLINRVNDIGKYVECLSSNKNTCTKTDKGTLCSSDCSNTFRLESNSEVKLWKNGSNSFGSTISPNYLEFGIKDVKIEVTQEKINVKLGSNLFEIPLDEDSIIQNSSIIMNAANKIDGTIRLAFNGIVNCARNIGLRCQ